eukprot:COSAG04_NODE_1754_length_5687_cov_2.326593_6_plen_49_part_00
MVVAAYAGHFKGRKFAQPASFIRTFAGTTDRGADAVRPKTFQMFRAFW